MNGGILAKLGGLLIKPALKGLKKRLDPAEYGVAMDFAEQDVVSIIKDKIAESKEMRN